MSQELKINVESLTQQLPLWVLLQDLNDFASIFLQFVLRHTINLQENSRVRGKLLCHWRGKREQNRWEDSKLWSFIKTVFFSTQYQRSSSGWQWRRCWNSEGRRLCRAACTDPSAPSNTPQPSPLSGTRSWPRQPSVYGHWRRSPSRKTPPANADSFFSGLLKHVLTRSYSKYRNHCMKRHLHVSRQHVHGFGSSWDVGHGLTVDGDVQVLNQDVIKNQLLKETVSVVPGVGSAHPKQPCLNLSCFWPWQNETYLSLTAWFW